MPQIGLNHGDQKRMQITQLTGQQSQYGGLPDCASKGISPLCYSDVFSKAVDFTLSQRLKLDSSLSEATSERLVAEATHEIAGGLQEQINLHRELGRDPYKAIGGDCGNVHLLIARFLLEEYPRLTPNLVMGSVVLNQQEAFNFSQEKFIEWRQNGYGDIFNCHAWVSLGQNWIIDATVGTWVHTRLGPGGAFGGVLYGPPSSLKRVPIANEKDAEQSLTGIMYSPVVLGVEAFSLVHQARERRRHDGA
jgi:hypothetical protein